LRHAKDLSVEELTKLASKHIKDGDKVVHKIQDFQQQLLKKDPEKFKAIHLNGNRDLLHEPTVHHHHHSQPTSSLLETSSEITRHHEDDDDVLPDVLIEAAAKKATEKAEDDIEALLSKADGAIATDKKLVKEIGGYHDKIRAIHDEYTQLAKSSANDVQTLRNTEALISKASHSHHAPAKSASTISNEELSLLEDAASKIERKGARRVRAKMGAQSEKHRRRRKHGHS